jgi:hypothetical protein
VRRGEVWWHEPPDSKRRPVLILTRDEAVDRVFNVIAVPATGTVRGLATEGWILASILHWMVRRGYQIKLLQVTKTPGGRQRWDLSYANAKRPCACISGKSRISYVFYQLRRQGGKGGADDMPDISLLAGDSPEHDAIWVIDPKHSARKAYRLANYQATGTRYVKSFGAKLAIIAEHYSRDDLPEGNPYRLDEHAWLVKDVRPRGGGLPMVLAELESFHPALQRTVLCVDVSSSFDDTSDCRSRHLSVRDRGRRHHTGGDVRLVRWKCVRGRRCRSLRRA